MTNSIEKLNADITEADSKFSEEGISLNASIENGEGESELDETLVGAVKSITDVSTTEHMRCDGLKENHVHTLINKLRQIVAIARTPKIDTILKRRAGKGAIIDQATRWGSTYLMIQCLLEIKDSLIDMAHLDITTEFQWRQAKEL